MERHRVSDWDGGREAAGQELVWPTSVIAASPLSPPGFLFALLILHAGGEP